MKAIPNGSTDITTYFVLRDSTTHAPKTNVTITDIDLYYQEQGAAQAAKADATALDAADSGHADNKAYHCGNGVYRIDWPDAAFDAGIGKTVILIVVCTGVDTCYRELILSPQVDVYSISGDATAADNLESYSDGTTPQPVDVTAWKGSTAPAMTGDAYARLGAPAGASVSADVAAVKSAVDTVDDYVDTEVAAVLAIAQKLDTALEMDGAVYRFTTNALEQAPSGGSLTAQQVWEYATRTLSDKTGFALTAAYDAAKAAAQDATVAKDATVMKAAGYTAPLDAAGTRTAVGLAAANLDTQLAGLPTDADVQTAAGAALTAYDPPTKAELDAGLAGVTAPTADAVADAVLDEALAGHVTAGTVGKALNDIGVSADPWTAELPGDYASGTAGYAFGRIQQTCETIGSLAITIQSPVAESGDITVYQGDDYSAADARSVTATVPTADVPDLAGATIQLKCLEATWTATACSVVGDNWSMVFEPDSADTAVLTTRQQDYEVEATLANTHRITLAVGTLTTVPDIPEVAS